MKSRVLAASGMGAAAILVWLAWPSEPDAMDATDPAGSVAAAGSGRPTRADRSISRPLRGSDGIPQNLAGLASRDPQRALAELAGLEDPETRTSSLTEIAAGWGTRDPQAAAEWLCSLESEEDRLTAALGLVPVWAEAAPESCFDWVQSRPADDLLREVAFVELADTWATHAPKTALDRFFTLGDESGRERGLHVIVSQWALDAPEVAVAALSDEAAPRRDEMLEAALVSLTNQDPELAWKYSDRFADAETVEHVRSMALEAMAEERPQDAINWAANAGNGEVLLAGVARGWAMIDEAAAAHWIKSLPDQDLAERLMQEISD